MSEKRVSDPLGLCVLCVSAPLPSLGGFAAWRLSFSFRAGFEQIEVDLDPDDPAQTSLATRDQSGDREVQAAERLHFQR